MTLFRAVEAGKSRSIDQVIRKISKVLPEEDIKKTELTSAPVKQIHAVVSEPAFELSKNEPIEIHVNPSKNEDLSSQGEPPLEFNETGEDVSTKPENEKHEQQPHPNVDVRQIQDEGEITKRVQDLPDELRKSLVDEFKEFCFD